jgi:hypothetical protein
VLFLLAALVFASNPKDFGADCEIEATNTRTTQLKKPPSGVQFDGKTGFGVAVARAIDWFRDHNNGGTEIDCRF